MITLWYFFSNKIQETILFLTIWTFSNQWEEDVCSTYRNLFFCLSLKSVNHTFSCNEIHRCSCYNHTYFRRRKKKFIIILPRKNKEESCLKNLVYTTFANIFFFYSKNFFLICFLTSVRWFSRMIFRALRMIATILVSRHN